MKKILCALALLTFSVTAMASGDKLVDTSEAVVEALTEFRKTQDSDTVTDFKGLKASPGDHGVTVKIYTNSRGTTNYGCHRHDQNEPFECHATN